MIEHTVNLNSPLLSVSLGHEPRPLPTPSSTPQQIAEAETCQVDVQPLLANIANSLASAKLQIEPVSKELSSLAISLAKLMFENLVGSSEDFQGDRLAKILVESFSQTECPVAAHLNSEDLEKVSQLLRSHKEIGEFKLEACARVPKGECRIEFNTHEMVSSLESQLDEIQARLQESLEDE